jgi:site-specific recombinase XerC
MARPIDPTRRALPLSEWPRADQDAWAVAQADGDIFEEGGGAAQWASRTRLTNIQHYGRWLGYLLWTGQLDQRTSPADRVTREGIRSYNRHLATLVAPRTRLSMLVGLKVMLQAMAPDRNWRWLQDACNRVQINAKPSKDKRARMRPTEEIFAAAVGELERLPVDSLSLKQALAYRDALMLAVLASRPLRVKNFSALELGRHLNSTDRGWLISIPADETKTRQPVSFELPELLLPWFERYLSEVRSLFPHAAETPRLWLGKDGVMRNSHSIYHRITRLTRRLFGVPINPHLLRDCAASSLAAISPDTARAAAPLLGHRHFSTTERHYIQANNLAASRRVSTLLDQLKSTLGEDA